ncbi:MAG: hypothetical protein K6F33_11295 [Bacteroidales bacterium]|nr:hypothetical protein [Bacteroidales bacterium]
MAKKNFKGGLNSLIENSLGIKKSRKGEMKGNPVDLIQPEQTDNNDEVLAKPRTPKKEAPAVKTTADTEQSIENTKVETKAAETPAQTAAQTSEPAAETVTEATQPANTTETSAPAPQQPSTATEPAANVATETTPPPSANTEQQAPSVTTEEPAASVTTEEPASSVTTEEPASSEQESQQTEAPQPVISVNLEADVDDNTKIAYLKEVISDLRHELFLWRNGTINVQTFNATLHAHGLKYNPENNEIEEFD